MATKALRAFSNIEIASLFDGSAYGPATISDKECRAVGSVIPAWLIDSLSPLVDEQERAALLDRAPLDLRANALKTNRDAAMAAFPEAQALDLSPFAIRLPTGTPIAGNSTVSEGLVEIQDLGSQIIVDACGAQPGMTVLDLCAGAGGKTLALAAAMNGKGRLIAADTNRNRLDQLMPRAARAGVPGIEIRPLDPGKERERLTDLAGQCDIVLVDAPCSGSGTWRRNPETRWRLDPARLKRVRDEQAKLLDTGAEMVASGGHLVYAVCSLIGDEGRGQMCAFLERNEGFKAVTPLVPAGRRDGDGVLLTPYHDGCDGFFFAKAQKL